MDKFKLFGFAPTEADLINGNKVKLRRPFALDKIEFVEYLTSKVDQKSDTRESIEVNANAITKTVIDDDNRLVFSDAKEVMQNMTLEDILSVGSVALSLLGLGADTKEDVKKK